MYDGPVPAQLEIGCEQRLAAAGGERRHRKSMIDRCARLEAAMRRRARRQQQTRSSDSAFARGGRRFEMAEMDGIERAAEDADAIGGSLMLRAASSPPVDPRVSGLVDVAQILPDRFLQRGEPFAADRGDAQEGKLLRSARALRARRRPAGSLTASIFVAATICGFAGELGAERRQLPPNRLEVLDQDRAPTRRTRRPDAPAPSSGRDA